MELRVNRSSKAPGFQESKYSVKAKQTSKISYICRPKDDELLNEWGVTKMVQSND